jgi:hypothetical protein
VVPATTSLLLLEVEDVPTNNLPELSMRARSVNDPEPVAKIAFRELNVKFVYDVPELILVISASVLLCPNRNE